MHPFHKNSLILSVAKHFGDTQTGRIIVDEEDIEKSEIKDITDFVLALREHGQARGVVVTVEDYIPAAGYSVEWRPEVDISRLL